MRFSLLPALTYDLIRPMCNATAAFFLLAAPALAEPVTVLALGDSLTAGLGLPQDEGFVPQLQTWLQAHGKDVTILNAGVSGDTTAGGLARLEWSLSPEVDAMIVNLGGNDLLRGLPPSEARANLDAILSGAQSHDLPVLLVRQVAPGNYGADYKTAFDAIYPELAASHGALLSEIYFAPLADPATGMVDPSYLQADGIHPSAAGVARIIEAIGPQVLLLLDEVAAAEN